ncbi:DUF6396 domain-containing protein [Pseudorhodoferax sp.]|uniref:SEL1-like repeat protein n=1 Tax=Pseudorhodoferax sp. TaxID=1993553 RepID=UPI0039E49BF2
MKAGAFQQLAGGTGKLHWWIVLLSGLTACQPKELPMPAELPAKPDLSFTCVADPDPHLPVTPEADVIFQKARAMEKAAGPKDFDTIARTYEQAVALGHWKAMQNAQVLYYQGLTTHPAPAQRVIDLNEMLIKLGAAIGYYNMATYLEEGYGVRQDRQAALAYYRKSADLGSPLGQARVGYLLEFDLKRPDAGAPMLECAVKQGQADAAWNLALHYRSEYELDMQKALNYLQISTALGGELAAFDLYNTFDKGLSKTGGGWNTSIDKERARRYRLILQVIRKDVAARFPDIDKIVPLPPAPLPPWDGTFEYQKQKGVPPSSS